MQNDFYPKVNAYARFKRLHRLSARELTSLHHSKLGETIFIVGTGPSIYRTALDRLNDRNVILLNNAVSLLPRFQPRWKALVVTDYLRMQESRHEFSKFDGLKICSTDRIFDPFADADIFDKPFLFVMPKHISFLKGNSVHVRVQNPGGFSDSLSNGIFLGFTVVFSAIQIAYHLGAKRIVLVGIDMDYTPGNGAYFDKSITDNWPTFSYNTHARDHFIEVEQFLSERSVEIFNATEGGAIDVLPRKSLLKNI